LRRTPCKTRIVAVACTVADVREGAIIGVEAIASAAAANRIMSNDNAVAAEW
jgi:broad specificity polyphosphatase/5'/3'-nucleotidase SurE